LPEIETNEVHRGDVLVERTCRVREHGGGRRECEEGRSGDSDDVGAGGGYECSTHDDIAHVVVR